MASSGYNSFYSQLNNQMFFLIFKKIWVEKSCSALAWVSFFRLNVISYKLKLYTQYVYVIQTHIVFLPETGTEISKN